MFDPRLVYQERQTRSRRLLDEAARDRVAASVLVRKERDHPVLGGMLMSVGAALLTMGMRMNMRRLLAAEGLLDAGYNSIAHDARAVTARHALAPAEPE